MAIVSGAAIGNTLIAFLQAAWKPLSLMIAGIVIGHVVYYGPKIDKKNLELALKEQEVLSLETIIKDQNEKIQEASDRSMEEFNRILDDLRSDLNDRDAVSREDLQEILDSTTPESCVEMNAFLLNQIENLQWEDE